MRFIILLFATLPLFGVNLLTYNIYERGDRVDIMLSFDSPYDGSIKQQVAGDKTSLMLSDLNVEEQIDKSINSSILQNIFKFYVMGTIYVFTNIYSYNSF